LFRDLVVVPKTEKQFMRRFCERLRVLFTDRVRKAHKNHCTIRISFLTGKGNSLKAFLLVGTIAMLVVAPGIASAQATFDGCLDINGVPVQSIQSTSINDVAIATIAQGYPVIFYNPFVVSQAPGPVRLFFYAHECGHHALGHIVAGRVAMAQEQEADCFGIKTLVDQDLIDDVGINLIQQTLDNFGPGDWTHLPGRQRAINLRHCLAGIHLGQRRQSPNDDDNDIEECIQNKIQGCMDDCMDNYQYSENACHARFCNPKLGSNRRWERSCQRKASR
jgi:hypothetical protein